MKSMTLPELKTFVTSLQELLVGAQLQEIVSNDRGLALGFRQKGTCWVIIDLNPAAPFCLIFADNPWRKGLKPKPVALFLNSHAKNLVVQTVTLDESAGRVLHLKLGQGTQGCELELQLIPRHPNLLVLAGDKRIAWSKPRELGPPNEAPHLPEPRDLETIHDEWVQEFKTGIKPSVDPQAQWEKKRTRDLEKKRKALAEIEEILARDSAANYYQLGELLKSLAPEEFRPERMPEEWKPLVDFQQGLFKNIESVFEKAKQAVSKRDGTLERKRILEEEIHRLESQTFTSAPSPRPRIDDLMAKTEARGRKLNLESGAIVYCGKSGADNLALLRKAKAWDYWLHLKDYPGAHAIIHRQRDQNLPQEELQKAALWLLKESLGSKAAVKGTKYAVLLVECRFVRPIKGDRLGRVTYHSEKQFSVTL